MNAITEQPQPAPADTQTRATDRRSRLLRRLWRPLAGLAAVIGIGVTASWWFTEGRYIESTDNAYVQGDIAVLSPRIEGDVAAIKVADNQRVRVGDPLIVLDPTDWRSRLAQATAAAAEAAAAVETAQRQVGQQQATIEAAQAAIVQAQAEQARATADATRSGSLVVGGWASRQANDQAIADSRKANAAVAAAQAQKAAAEQQLAVLRAQVVAGQGATAERRRRSAAGGEQPRLHRDPCAVRRHRRQPGRRTWPACYTGAASSSRSRHCVNSSTSSPTSRRRSFAACSPA